MHSACNDATLCFLIGYRQVGCDFHCYRYFGTWADCGKLTEQKIDIIISF
jgi:hypothetical protein